MPRSAPAGYVGPAWRPRRDETDAERYDRNWSELIQELRVAQTGVQVLAGFLLTLPFTHRFFDIGDGHRVVYLVAFSLAVITVGLMTAPVALHRFLFGHHEKDVLVRSVTFRQVRAGRDGPDPGHRGRADLRGGGQRRRRDRRRGRGAGLLRCDLGRSTFEGCSCGVQRSGDQLDTPSSEAAQQAHEQELARAEQRGADRVRAQLRELLDDRRRIVRMGDHQIEVVEVSAITELLDGDAE